MNSYPEQRAGVLFALSAFVFWGFFPVYIKALGSTPAVEILGHRVCWSVPFIAALLCGRRGWATLWRALASRRARLTLVASTVLVSANWATFIYGVTSGRILETSLGYYMNPLVSVVLGTVVLGERLRRLQIVAVLLAAAGTLNLAARANEFPWIALTLAMSFGVYGLLRKTVAVDSLGGLFVETSLLFPLAFGYLVFLAIRGEGAFLRAGTATSLLLSAGGAVTALPLIWFTSSARRLPYSTLALFQYLSPSLSFLLAVFAYGEPFTAVHAFTFGCIWIALVVFAADTLAGLRSVR
jgi:chloramphenicol-sensitive protein RarD